jgi:LacI family transcriptional regulator
MPTCRRVALLIESSRAYGRRVLVAISHYAKLHGSWSIYFEQRQTGEKPPDWLKTWKGDGIISRVDDLVLARAIRRTGLPAVDLRGIVGIPMPLVKANDDRVAEMAADHLLERGFVNVAYCGYEGLSYSERRLKRFRPYVEDHGLECRVYLSPPPRANARQRDVECVGVLREQGLAEWISLLPKPVGIMACNDVRGQQVLNTCREMDVAVPEQLALLGVDNDEVLCELSDPPMTSVELDTQTTGHEAAALLDRMMNGEAPPAEAIFIDPVGIVARQSTNVLAIEDAHVAAAMRFIRLHAIDGCDVEDVVGNAAISRRALERRFSKVLSRTINEELLRVQVDRVKQLLTETDWPLAQVADRSGFLFPEYMSVVFKREMGTTPGEYRRSRQEQRR